jgi:hypothetical protein
LYPQRYDEILDICRRSGATLANVEDLSFSQNHAAVLARLLQAWNIPADVFKPLIHLLDDYRVLVGCLIHLAPIRRLSQAGTSWCSASQYVY